MKHHFACVAACAVALLAGAACQDDTSMRQAGAPTSTQKGAPAVPASLARVDFHVEGMTCGGCEAGTRAVLRKVEGVRDAGASYDDSSAWAVYDPTLATPEQMMAAIRQLGYKPSIVEGGAPAAPVS